MTVFWIWSFWENFELPNIQKHPHFACQKIRLNSLIYFQSNSLEARWARYNGRRDIWKKDPECRNVVNYLININQFHGKRVVPLCIFKRKVLLHILWFEHEILKCTWAKSQEKWQLKTDIAITKLHYVSPLPNFLEKRKLRNSGNNHYRAPSMVPKN